MNRAIKSLLLLTLLGTLTESAAGFPAFLIVYQNDPFRIPDVDGCVVCHVNPGGGGPRNGFGQAFETSDMTITPLLRSRFPDHFTYNTAPLGGATILHFTDPDNASLVVEVGGERYLADLASRSVPGAPAGQETPRSVAAVESAPEPAQVATVDRLTSEGAYFGPRIVNLPNGKGTERGGVEFLIGHRFAFPLFDRDSPANLFGLDSSAFVTFGAGVGLTDWLSVSAMRSNLDRTVELSSSLQTSRQSAGAPVSSQFRLGIEGRDNFRERFAPFLQFIATRSFGGRVSLTLAPSVAFNTRDEDSLLPPEFLFGDHLDYTASIGIGAGVRLLPSVSLVGEYVPRVRGFAGEFFDRPAVSIGVQKATFRHTFELVISTARPMTTAQYTVNGTDAFKIGFNIYRRLR